MTKAQRMKQIDQLLCCQLLLAVLLNEIRKFERSLGLLRKATR